jgi:hypothetical protein
MARLLPLTLNEDNDETVDLTVTSNVFLTVADCTFELVIKASADADDEDGTVLTVGDGITVVTTAPTATTVALTATVPAADLAAPGRLFWRLDLLVGGQRHTALYGPLTIRNL